MVVVWVEMEERGGCGVIGLDGDRVGGMGDLGGEWVDGMGWVVGGVEIGEGEKVGRGIGWGEVSLEEGVVVLGGGIVDR